MKKKGIELSVNFTVILILSIVVFIFGIMFISRLSKGADKSLKNLPSQEEFKIKSCLNEGKYVCLGTNRQEARMGNSILMGIGISNKLDITEFQLYTEFSMGTKENGDPIEEGEVQIKTGDNPEIIEVENYATKIISMPFVISPGSPTGEYVYNVFLCVDNAGEAPDNTRDKCYQRDSSLMYYGGLHKIYLDVI